MILVFGLMVVLCIIIFMLYRLMERIEDNLVDIELTYERMRCVITYLKDCIEFSAGDKSDIGR